MKKKIYLLEERSENQANEETEKNETVPINNSLASYIQRQS
jgi:hypothetical protein